jgi:hypothetical protein
MSTPDSLDSAPHVKVGDEPRAGKVEYLAAVADWTPAEERNAKRK